MAETDVKVNDLIEIVFEPLVEENEDELFKKRAKLFRWAKESNPPEWKERGTGNVTLLKHKESSKIRLLMRREKTFKTCANHYLDPCMKLEANIGSDRAWVWTAPADFADEEAKEELLAIRFANSEVANEFKAKFEECQGMMKKLMSKCEDDAKEDAAPLEEESKDAKKDEVDPTEQTVTKEAPVEEAALAEKAHTEKISAEDKASQDLSKEALDATDLTKEEPSKLNHVQKTAELIDEEQKMNALSLQEDFQKDAKEK